MQTQSRFFDDLARIAGGAAGALSGVRNEVEGLFRQQFEKLFGDLNLATREEMEAVHGMASEARTAQERLVKRIAALEARLGAGPAGRAVVTATGPRKPGRAVRRALRQGVRRKQARAKK